VISRLLPRAAVLVAIRRFTCPASSISMLAHHLTGDPHVLAAYGQRPTRAPPVRRYAAGCSARCHLPADDARSMRRHARRMLPTPPPRGPVARLADWCVKHRRRVVLGWIGLLVTTQLGLRRIPRRVRDSQLGDAGGAGAARASYVGVLGCVGTSSALGSSSERWCPLMELAR
jgi:hypothetical protein